MIKKLAGLVLIAPLPVVVITFLIATHGLWITVMASAAVVVLIALVLCAIYGLKLLLED